MSAASAGNGLLDSLRVLLWMGVPVLMGYLLWTQALRRREDGEQRAARLSRSIGRLTLLGGATPLMFLVLWVARLAPGTTLLPLVGVAVHFVGSLAGWGCARALSEPRRRHGVYLLGGGCSNVLAFGGITIVLLLASREDPHAESALGEMAMYRIAEAPYYFLVAWPLAAAISRSRDASSPGWVVLFRRALLGPQLAPVLGLVAGGVLNLSGVERPESLSGVAEILVRVNVVLLGITVGLGLRRADPLLHLKPCLAISTVKFLVMPALGVSLAWLLGLRGSSLQVVAICASMPVAFMAVLGAVLYRLDDELIGSFWLFTTAAMVIVVPLLAAVVPSLG